MMLQILLDIKYENKILFFQAGSKVVMQSSISALHVQSDSRTTRLSHLTNYILHIKIKHSLNIYQKVRRKDTQICSPVLYARTLES